MQSIIGLLDDRIALLPFWTIIIIYTAVLLVIVAVSLWRRWLTLSGVVGAFVMGFIVLYFGGFSAFTLFFFFFFSCSVLSKIKRAYNKREKKGSQRDLMQVIANGLPAVLSIFLTRSPHFYYIAMVGYGASLAEAMADTWAGTFGMMSKRDPLSIITFTRVPKGISGGVTALGFLFSAIGSSIMAFLYMILINYDWHHFLIISGTGFVSCVVDSILGATLQEHFRNRDGELTEKEWESGVKNVRVRGIPGFDNDMVNLTSGILALSLSLFLASIF